MGHWGNLSGVTKRFGCTVVRSVSVRIRNETNCYNTSSVSNRDWHLDADIT